MRNNDESARYHSITLEPDDLGEDWAYKLKFSTGPGMSTSIGELRMADLDALADILADRYDTPLLPLRGSPADATEG